MVGYLDSPRRFFMKNSSALLILLSLLTSCGYTLQGGGKLPGKVETVSVAIFKNKSSQSGAEAIFTNALIEELMKNSSVKVLNHKKDDGQMSQHERESSMSQHERERSVADAAIRGTIISISFNALARTSDDAVYKRKVTAIIDLEMKSRSGEVLFAVNNFIESEYYTVSNSNSINEAVISSTVQKIADQLSRRLVSQMSDDF